MAQPLEYKQHKTIKMKKIFLPLAFFVILLESCKKEVASPDPVDPTTPTELKANASFKWQTTRNIIVTVTGTPVSANIQRKFSVQLEDGSLVYAANHNMKDNFEFTLSLPAHATKLIYNYGSISKEVAVSGNNVAMNYLVETENGYDLIN